MPRPPAARGQPPEPGLLILASLAGGPKHGYGIVEHLRTASGDVLSVGESALYPALQRILLNGWAKAEWGASENNRRARFYRLTRAGRKQLQAETRNWEQTSAIVARFFQLEPEDAQ